MRFRCLIGKSLLLQEELQQKEAELKESRDEINRLSSHNVKYEEKIDQLQIQHQQTVKELKDKLQECQLELKEETEKQSKKHINVHVKVKQIPVFLYRLFKCFQ